MTKVLEFLATGDLQCDNWSQFSRTLPNGRNSRLQNCLKVFDLLGKEGKKRGINRILINGDVFEETDYLQVEVYNAVFRRIKKLHDSGFDIVFNLGNHDITSINQNLIHSLTPFQTLSRVLRHPGSLWKFLSVYPWQDKRESIKSSIKYLTAGKQQPLCGVFHASVSGSIIGNSAYRYKGKLKVEDLCPERFNLILLSDFHTKQYLAPNIVYMGSPLQHTFGETHDPCIWHVTLFDKAPWFSLEEIPTNLPKFRKVTANTKEDLEKLLTKHSNDYLAITSKLPDGFVQAQADKHNCLIRIEHERKHKKIIVPSKVTNIESAVDSYVQKFVLSNAKKEVLKKLALDLYG